MTDIWTDAGSQARLEIFALTDLLLPRLRSMQDQAQFFELTVNYLLAQSLGKPALRSCISARTVVSCDHYDRTR